MWKISELKKINLKMAIKKATSVLLSLCLISGLLPTGLTSPNVSAAQLTPNTWLEYNLDDFIMYHYEKQQDPLNQYTFFDEVFDNSAETKKNIIHYLQNNKKYLVYNPDSSKTLEFTCSVDGSSPFEVEQNATVYLYIYGKVKISGTNAGPKYPGTAGIYVPGTSSIYIRSYLKNNGDVTIKGGDASAGTRGLDGNNATATDSPGSGGTGGNGGNGGGAGIGTHGAKGGIPSESADIASGKAPVVNGHIYLFLVGCMPDIKGGIGGEGGNGGDGGKNASWKGGPTRAERASGSGGGGGGGGGGYPGQAVGLGGPGGGAGGAGGKGGFDYEKMATAAADGGGGGGGGRGYNSGGGGGRGCRAYVGNGGKGRQADRGFGTKQNGEKNGNWTDDRNGAGQGKSPQNRTMDIAGLTKKKSSTNEYDEVYTLSGGMGGDAPWYGFGECDEQPEGGSAGGDVYTVSAYRTVTYLTGMNCYDNDYNKNSTMTESTKLEGSEETITTTYKYQSFASAYSWADTKDLDSAKVRIQSNQVYNGTPIIPEVEVWPASSWGTNGFSKWAEGANLTCTNNENANLNQVTGEAVKKNLDSENPRPRPEVALLPKSGNVSSSGFAAFPFDIVTEDITKVRVYDLEDMQYSPGGIFEPVPTLVFQPKVGVGVVLKNGTDYTVKYFNHQNAGRAYMTFTPTSISNFHDSLSAQFNITPISLNDGTFVGKQSNKTLTYSGSPQVIDLSHVNVYKRSGEIESLITQDNYELAGHYEFTDAGTYEVKVVGKNNYVGEISCSITINRLEMTKNNIEIDEIPNRIFNGAAQIPSPTVYHKLTGGKKKLTMNKDYYFIYDNNTDADAARAPKSKALVTACGQGNFTGTVSQEFHIDPAPITVYPKPDQSAPYGILASELRKRTIEYLVSGAVTTGTYAPTFEGALKIEILDKNIDAEGCAKASGDIKDASGEVIGTVIHRIKPEDDDFKLDSSKNVNKNYILTYDSERNNEFLIYTADDDPKAVAVPRGTQGLNGWYTGVVTIKAPDGYAIRPYPSAANTKFASDIKIDSNGVFGVGNEYGYVLQKISDFAVLPDKKVTFKQDMLIPSISRDNNAATSPVQEEKIVLKLGNLGPSALKETGSIKFEMQSPEMGGSWETIYPDADTDYTYSHTAVDNGTYKFRATNQAGVTSDIFEVKVDQIDRIAPEAKIELTDSDNKPFDNGAWTNKDINIRIGNKTANLGTTTYWYQKIVSKPDGTSIEGEWTEIAPDSEGNYLLTHKISETEENNGNIVNYRIKLISEAGLESVINTTTIKENIVVPSIYIDIKDDNGDKRWDKILSKTDNSQTVDISSFSTTLFNAQKIFTVTCAPSIAGDKIAYTSYFILESDGAGDLAIPPTNPEEIEKIAASHWETNLNNNTISSYLYPNKKYVVYAKTADSAGNVAYASTDIIIIDTEAPTFEARYSYNNIWTALTPNIMIENIKDNLWTAKEISMFYKLAKKEDDLKTASLQPLTIKNDVADIAFADGQSFVQIFAQDKLENMSSSSVFCVKKDQVAPTIDVTVDDLDTYTSFKEAHISTSAGPSGIKSVQVQKEGSTEWIDLTYESENSYTYTITERGNYTFRIENNVFDETNDKYVCATQNVNVEKIAKDRPAVSVSAYLGSDLLRPYTFDTWTNENVLIKFKNTTEGITIAKYEYTIEGETTYNTLEADFEGVCTLPEVSQDGEYKFIFKITSTEDLESDEISCIVKKHSQPPTGKLQMLGTSNEWLSLSQDKNNLVFNTAQQVKITDVGSPAESCSIEYFIKTGTEDKKIEAFPKTEQEIENAAASQGEWLKGKPEQIFELTPDKQYIIYAKITDGANNKRYISTDLITIDATPPSFSMSLPNYENWVASAAMTMYDFKDNLSEIDSIFYETYNVETGALIAKKNVWPKPPSEPETGEETTEGEGNLEGSGEPTEGGGNLDGSEQPSAQGFPGSVSVSFDDGNYKVKLFVQDNAGNIKEAEPFIIKQDSSIPSLELGYDDSAPEPVKDVTITVPARDGIFPPSGIKEIQVLEPGESEWKLIEFSNNNPITTIYKAAKKGDYEFRVISNTNISSETYSITLDKISIVPPVINLKPTVNDGENDGNGNIEERPSYADGSWTNKDVDILLYDSADNPSTPDSPEYEQTFYYKVNGGEYQRLEPDADGKYIVKGPEEDGIYNYTFKIVYERFNLESEEATLTIKKDTTAPSVKISSENNEWTSTGGSAASAYYFNESQTLHILGEDMIGKLNSGVQQRNMAMADEDRSSNAASGIALLSDDPEISAYNGEADEPSENVPESQPDNGTSGTENGEDSSEKFSGIASVKHFILSGTDLEKVIDNLPESAEEIEKLVGSESNWIDGETVQLDPSNKYVVYAKVTDAAGNSTYSRTDKLVIDNQNPQIDIIYPFDGIWVPKASVTIENISDDVSGLKEAYYILDDEEPREIDLSQGSKTLADFDDGTHTLYVKAEDNAGNVNLTGKIYIMQDSVKPSIKVQASDGEFETEKQVIVSPSAGISGIKSVEVQEGYSSEWKPIDIDKDTNSYIYTAKSNGYYKFRTTSNAGLISDEVAQAFEKIDPPIYADNSTSNFLKEGDLKSSFYTGLIALVVSSTLAMIYVAKRGRGKKRKKNRRK